MTLPRRWLAWSVAGALAAIVLAYATAVGYMMANEVALVFAPNARDHAVAPDIARRIERVPRTVGHSPGLLWVLRGTRSMRRAMSGATAWSRALGANTSATSLAIM